MVPKHLQLHELGVQHELPLPAAERHKLGPAAVSSIAGHTRGAEREVPASCNRL